MRIVTADDLRKDLILNYFENYILPKVVLLPGNPKPENRGGYLGIRRTIDGEVLDLMRVGDFLHRHAEKYEMFSLKKGKRLYHHIPNFHVSSFQSRNLEKGRHAGAIVAGDFIVSFAGLSEFIDEAAILELSTFSRWIPYKEAEKIAKISNNFFYPHLKKTV